MNNTIKKIVILINAIVLILSLLWIYSSDFDYEPMIVFLGQTLSILTIKFGEQIQSKFFIKNVSDSKVNIDISKSTTDNYDISNITKKSSINIKKN